MKEIKYTFILAFVLIAGTSCSITLPLTATNNPIGQGKGVSNNTCIFSFPGMNSQIGNSTLILTSSGICLNKNYGIREATTDGSIEKVATVDLKTTNFVLWKTYQLIVTGE